MGVLVLELLVTKLMGEPRFPFRPRCRACGELTISATCPGFIQTTPLSLVAAGRRGPPECQTVMEMGRVGVFPHRKHMSFSRLHSPEEADVTQALW